MSASIEALDDPLLRSMHSSVAGDIHVSLAHTLSRTTSSKSSKGSPWIDKAHVALLENLEETDETEETSFIAAKRDQRVNRTCWAYAGAACAITHVQ